MNAPAVKPAHDTTTMKVDSRFSPPGDLHGEYHLASCKTLAMRLFRLNPGDQDKPHTREYEYAGYVIKGVAELTTSGNVLRLNPGSAYLIPAGSPHSFRIIEGPFQACEATCPPYFVHNRDKPIDKAQARV